MRKISLLLIFLLWLGACSPPAPVSAPDETTPAVTAEGAIQDVIEESAPIRMAQGAKQGTYYEVFVRSFADSNGDGIGDFAGLTQKMDYFSDMGVTGLWLMPSFESPSYHGYDTTDYYKINSDYGTMEDFEAFIAAAKERDIAVILDLVINHSSSENEWFIQSRDPESPYRDWYHWSDTGEDVNLTASFYGNQVWTQEASGYYAGLFWQGMPDLNLSNPDVTAEVKKIAKFWLDKGVSGFRLDAAMYLFTSMELPVGTGVATEQENLKWWKDFTDYCRSINPKCYIVGEVWDAAATRAPYVSALDSVFHFDMGDSLARAVTRGSDKGNSFANSMKAEYDRLRSFNQDAIDAPFLSNHDQNRICTALGNKLENLKMAASIYLTLEGLPFVYYGEELGMLGGKPDENIRTPFMWGEGDPVLTSWYESVYNKKVQPYSEQTNDENSLLNHYKKLINLRAATPALFAGKLEPVDPGNDVIMAYTMTATEQSVLVLHNLSKEQHTIDMDSSGTVLFGSCTRDTGRITLEPQSTLIIER